MKHRRELSRSGIDILEEALNTLRQGPRHVISMYYIGALPFVLGLLVFWSKMSHSALALHRLPLYSLMLAGLFAWMKGWQSLFTHRLLDHINGVSPEPISLKSFMITVLRQTVIQSTGLFVIPFSFLLILPFGQTYAFYQTSLIRDDGSTQSLSDLIRISLKQSVLWSRQNYIIIWLSSPVLMVFASILFVIITPAYQAISPEQGYFLLAALTSLFLLIMAPLSPVGMMVFANLTTCLLAIPQILKTLTGFDSVLTSNPGGLMNSLFFLLVAALTYLIMDPVLKTAYVLRCFYADSLKTGIDIRVALKKFSAALWGVILLSGMIITGTIHAQEQHPELPVGTAETLTASSDTAETLTPFSETTSKHRPTEILEISIVKELQKDRYAWKLPHYKVEGREQGPIMRFFKSINETIGEWLRKIRKWLKELFNWSIDFDDSKSDSSTTNIHTLTVTLKVIMIFLVVLLIVLLIYQLNHYMNRLNKQSGTDELVLPDDTPDLESESTTAADLPENAWLRLAIELSDKGDYRLALRAMYLSILAWLGDAHLIYLARHKTNRDYLSELCQHIDAMTIILPHFKTATCLYESVWYGIVPADSQMFAQVYGHRKDMVQNES